MYRPGFGVTVPPMVSLWSYIGWLSPVTVGGASSATYASAARAVYYPIIIPAGCVVRRVWWANGATTTGGATIEVGVYADSGYGPGAKLVSGSATQGTASEVQFVDVTDTTLPPGLYWIAIMSSSATNTTLFRGTVPQAGAADAAVLFHQTSANPLPATATPVEAASTDIWLCGFATTASP
jgi:hypothetical protein